MALEEYKRKRDFKATPEPGPKVEKGNKRRFVVQKHRASHMHFDFRLEMNGVLVSWAVPKGPSLDPAEKRLAMHVEDHPVSYFHFEGIIPPGNYGAGTVQVWDDGTWEPLGDANEMYKKGDFKFRLKGKKLNGEFVLARMRSKRPGSKGTEWLLIKKRDEAVVEGFDALDPEYDWSILTKRSLAEIGGDEKSKEWISNRAASAPVAKKNSWLAASVAKADKLKRAGKTPPAVATEEKPAPTKARRASPAKKATKASSSKKSSAKEADSSTASVERSDLKSLKGARPDSFPRRINPMLATLVDEPFDDRDWLYEVKFDGYRAVAFIKDGSMRLVSRNDNDFTHDFPEIGDLPKHIRAKQAVVDGEVCVLDDEGRPSFSLMQQRTGFEPGKARKRSNLGDRPIVYYAFDIIHLDGYSLERVDCDKRKEILRSILDTDLTYRFSDHFDNGKQLFEVARSKGLEGIIAKRRKSCYEQKRTSDWLKVKVTMRQECVIGGYTDPRGARENFGSLVLGLYDKQGRLFPVGQAGSGFTHKTHEEMWQRLKKLQTAKNPFASKPDSDRKVHFVEPKLVAEIKFTEWTHEGQKGGLKMRAPVYQGLRVDKKPEQCVFELKKSSKSEAEKAESGRS